MKTALITGVGKGIGRSLAQKFLAEGWHVLGTTTSGKADYSHEHLQISRLDLADPASITSCTEAFKKSSTHFDVLINNAGILLDDEETHLIPEKLRGTLEVNLIGTADFTERMLESVKDGHIIFLSSQAGSLGDMDHLEDSHFPYHYPAYKISKCALNMYIRTLAARLIHEGSSTIVSAVHPGWVKTAMGGNEAPVPPETAAEHIYTLALSKPKTGQFWFNGKKYPW